MLRRIAHPMLATAFVADGIDTLTDPDPRIKAATAALQKREQRLPPTVAAYLPSDPARLVRINAAIRIGGGALLAIGKLPRLSAAVLAATFVPAALSESGFWTEHDPERRASKRNDQLRDVSLLGGLLIASTGRRGRPSLGWRGRRAVARLLHADPSAPDRLAEAAKEHGPELAAALRTGRERVAEAAREHGPELGAALHDQGERLVSAAQQHSRRLADSSRELAAHWSEVASDRSGQLVGVARGQGANLERRPSP
ncbi:DoxX family protein [Nocardia tengchongensis]|uniref:DoxX family protein n=1 Tax=Nocardia tengchongensis TaxID=2055889 RepID=A0ABX8CK70_9NOCA|nr:DoxX family membrane protein [Nocardia tengchongensis]QVI19223.1 DoxX family protein [Nocardia tengchongensis]